MTTFESHPRGKQIHNPPTSSFPRSQTSMALSPKFYLRGFYLQLLKLTPLLDMSVRVKGGMSVRNGMWHGLRNDIIMRNLIYAE